MGIIKLMEPISHIRNTYNSMIEAILKSLNQDGTTKRVFGAWEPKAFNTTYTAPTDGIVTAYSHVGGVNDWVLIVGLTDTNPSPSTIRVTNAAYFHTGTTVGYAAITMPVKKGHKWRTIKSGVGGAVDEAIYFLPIGE